MRRFVVVLVAGVVASARAGADPSEELLLTVDGAVRLALGRSLDLREARLGLQEAGAQVSEAWGQVYPRVDFSASYARNLSPAVFFVPANAFDPTAPEGEFRPLQFSADNSWQSQVSVSQPLFDPGVFVGLGAAERFRRLQAEIVRGRTQQVVTRVRLACYDLLLRAEEVHLSERSLARVRQALEETRARRAAGLASDYDVLRLEVEAANLEPDLLRARNALASARRRLALELAIDEPQRVRLSEDESLTAGSVASGVEETPDSKQDLVNAAERQRSDVRQLELTVALRRTQVRLEQADYLPTVSLFGSWDVQAQQSGSPDFFGDETSRATTKTAGVRIDLPVFTGLQRRARVGQRQAALRQAETQLQMARDRAATDVRDLVEARTEARARAGAQALAMTQAGRGFEIALARYRRGLGSRLEVTDAEVALRRSEFNHARAAHDLLAVQARLDLAVGRVKPVDGPMEERP